MARDQLTLGEPKRRRGGALRWLLILLAAVLLTPLGLATLRTGAGPEIAVEPELPGIGPRTPVTVRLDGGSRGLAPVRVELVQGERTFPLAARDFAPQPAWVPWGDRVPAATLTVEPGHETLDGLTQGEATLRVIAERPGTWLRRPPPVVEELTLPVRVVPPSLEVLSRHHYVTQGGSGLVVYRVGEGAAQSGVRAGEHVSPGHPLPGGAADERFALFAAPYDLADGSQIVLTAVDDLGNRARLPFLDGFTPKPWAEGTIRLDDAFLARVVPEIAGRTEGFSHQGSLLEDYLWINRELRRRNRARVAELAAASEPAFLWRGVFRPLPDGQVMSPFATHRTYLYGGETVDEQFHLGYDLASVRRAEVPAAQSGKVVHAGWFGIYGEAVVVDHGYGLLTLYGHLSGVDVAVGDRVEAGQVLGRTGQSGLAGGDHLHFGVFLHGMAVDAREWWDGRWIGDRILPKLGDAFPE